MRIEDMTRTFFDEMMKFANNLSSQQMQDIVELTNYAWNFSKPSLVSHVLVRKNSNKPESSSNNEDQEHCTLVPCYEVSLVLLCKWGFRSALCRHHLAQLMVTISLSLLEGYCFSFLMTLMTH